MFIKDYYNNKKNVISFEVFPPNKNFSEEIFFQELAELKKLHPDFISVTCSVDNEKKDKTCNIASYIKNELSIECLVHLTCIGTKRTEMNQFLNKLSKHNIKNILALRGDIPENFELPKGDYTYASELVYDIKKEHSFSVAGAFYPEVHQENNDLIDLINLKTKVDTGIDFLISQIFFDNSVFLKFRDNCHKLGIQIPLIPGIISAVNPNQIKRIAKLCACSIPKKLENIIDKYKHNSEAMFQAGIIYATQQIIELLSEGVEGVHLYTMNNAKSIQQILTNINHIKNV